MNGLSLLVWMTLAQLPAVDVVTLTDVQHRGTLESMSAESVVVKTDEATVSVPYGEVLLIRSTMPPVALANETFILVQLVDGSRLRVTKISSSGTEITASHSKLGELKLPLTSVASVRMAAADPKIDSEWNQLLDRAPKKDMVAVRKGDVLDHLDGVIGSMSDSTLQFQLDGDDIAVKREKVFGLIYSKRDSTARKAVALFDLVSGDQLALKQVVWNGKAWTVRLVSGPSIDVAQELFSALDFTISKFTYLSDLEPRTVKHTPYFDIPDFHVFDYRRDRNFDGNRISVGQKAYAKGLAIHSRTQLKYRLGGDFRRFQAIMGIGDEINRGDVDVIIKADDKVIFTGSAKAIERGEKGVVQRAAPQTLDIDVTGVVELEIFVDFGSDKVDIGDRLYLANARAVR